MYRLEEAFTHSQAIIKSNLQKTGLGIDRLTSYLASVTGKGLRARLLLICAQDAQGDIHPDACKAAAAIEILHLASLVHDDVMDGATTRRGLQTLNDRFDSRTAVIVGDYLLATGMGLIAEIGEDRVHEQRGEEQLMFVTKIAKTLASLARGEYEQQLNLRNPDIDVMTYFRIISGKTASLFYVSCFIGAYLAGEPAANVRRLGRFGHAFGMAFQIFDDVKDYDWDETTAGKTIEADLKNGVMTLPVIFAMRKDKSLRRMVREAMITGKDTQKLLSYIREAGTVDETQRVSTKYLQICKRHLSYTHESKQQDLLLLLEKLGT